MKPNSSAIALSVADAAEPAMARSSFQEMVNLSDDEILIRGLRARLFVRRKASNRDRARGSN